MLATSEVYYGIGCTTWLIERNNKRKHDYQRRPVTAPVFSTWMATDQLMDATALSVHQAD